MFKCWNFTLHWVVNKLLNWPPQSKHQLALFWKLLLILASSVTLIVFRSSPACSKTIKPDAISWFYTSFEAVSEQIHKRYMRTEVLAIKIGNCLRLAHRCILDQHLFFRLHALQGNVMGFGSYHHHHYNLFIWVLHKKTAIFEATRESLVVQMLSSLLAKMLNEGLTVKSCL